MAIKFSKFSKKKKKKEKECGGLRRGTAGLLVEK